MLAEVLQWAPDGWIWVYFISSSSVLYVDPDPGRWFITGSLRKSRGGSSGRGGCRGTATKNGEKNPSHRALCPGNPAPASARTAPQRDPRLFEKAALREVCADCKVHHTNTDGRVHAERHAIALPGHATCPMNAHQVPWGPALGSLKYRTSVVHALALFHPCEPHRVIPSPPPSAPAVAWAPWPNDIQKIPSFHNCSLGAAAPPG